LADRAELSQLFEGLLPGQDDEIAGECYVQPVELVVVIGLGVSGLHALLG